MIRAKLQCEQYDGEELVREVRGLALPALRALGSLLVGEGTALAMFWRTAALKFSHVCGGG